jgi:HD-like signal output (HDOD) protein
MTSTFDVDALARDAARLDPLPTSAAKLARLVGAGDPPFEEIVELVEYDQAMTATLLRSANSSWSASRTEITTVRDAVLRLGSGPVLSCAVASHVRGRITSAIPEYGLGEHELWEHSVTAMLAAELIGRAASCDAPPEAATAALLHDVGKLILARHLDRSLLDRLEDAQDAGVSRLRAELEVLGTSHAGVGGLVAQSWGLPRSLVCAIEAHHEPETRADVLPALVHVADVVAERVGPGRDDDEDADRLLHALARLGCPPATVEAVCTTVAQRLPEVMLRLG